MKTEPDAWPSLIRNSVKNIEELANHIELTEEEKIQITDKLPLRITEYYLDLIKKYPVLRKTVIPTLSEFKISDGESNDPLKEEGYNPTKCIVHKYPDRALLLVSNFCSVNCRYCTRSRIFDDIGSSSITKNDLEDAFQYIRNHKELRDIIVSGGDPLTMSDGNLEWILQKLRSIEHVEIIRIGTKMPVVLPSRITTKLVDMLKKYHPLYMSVHFTHPYEITPECSKALNKIANAGIVMRSQTVLLKGVNDDVEIMKNLMHKLLLNRVSPYYIYNTDYIIGSEHFRCSIDKGLEIIKGLRGFTSGYAVPSYVVDTEHGKIILNPNNIIENDDKFIRLKSYTGEIVEIKKTT
jgi:lysine 2,3-aminomutase